MSDPHETRRSAPAALRNREPIAEVLREELPASGRVLEIASGTGEHAAHFARSFPALEWQPSDADPAALRSIAAWREWLLTEGAGGNLLPALSLNVLEGPWPTTTYCAVVCINMVHISPPAATEALLGQCGRLLPEGAPVIFYGPYLEDGVEPEPSNLAFDRSLKARDPAWGLRRVEWLDELATHNGLVRTRRVAMPANNLVLVYRRRR